MRAYIAVAAKDALFAHIPTYNPLQPDNVDAIYRFQEKEMKRLFLIKSPTWCIGGSIAHVILAVVLHNRNIDE